MRQKHTGGRSPSRYQDRWRDQSEAGLSTAFRAQTFTLVDAVYADALCLTGHREEAADLVVETYLRASQAYDEFRRRSALGDPSPRETLAWLYQNLHAAFCDQILARNLPCGTRIGELP